MPQRSLAFRATHAHDLPSNHDFHVRLSSHVRPQTWHVLRHASYALVPSSQSGSSSEAAQRGDS